MDVWKDNPQWSENMYSSTICETVCFKRVFICFNLYQCYDISKIDYVLYAILFLLMWSLKLKCIDILCVLQELLFYILWVCSGKLFSKFVCSCLLILGTKKIKVTSYKIMAVHFSELSHFMLPNMWLIKNCTLLDCSNYLGES